MAPDVLRHAFDGVTLTTNEVRTIALHLEGVGALDIRANGARLLDVAQVDAVIAEDVVLDRLVLSAADGDDRVEFVFEHSGIVVRCDDDRPPLRQAYEAVCALLRAKARNGFASCSIDVSPSGSWSPPPGSSAPRGRAPAGSERSPAQRGGRWTRWLRALDGRRRRSNSR